MDGGMWMDVDREDEQGSGVRWVRHCWEGEKERCEEVKERVNEKKKFKNDLWRKYENLSICDDQ